MGMFDNLRVKISLPDLSDEVVKELIFQTKDTETQFMENYEISEDRRLMHMCVEYETVPEEKRPYYGKPNWEGIGQFLGCVKTIKKGWEDTKFHGDIRFYTNIDYKWLDKYCDTQENGDCISNHPLDMHSINKITKGWYEYEARFTEGILTKIERVYV